MWLLLYVDPSCTAVELRPTRGEDSAAFSAIVLLYPARCDFRFEQKTKLSMAGWNTCATSLRSCVFIVGIHLLRCEFRKQLQLLRRCRSAYFLGRTHGLPFLCLDELEKTTDINLDVNAQTALKPGANVLL